MVKVKVKTLRPLNGEPEGKVRMYDAADAKRLAACGAVRLLGKSQGRSASTKAEGRSESTR